MFYLTSTPGLWSQQTLAPNLPSHLNCPSRLMPQSENNIKFFMYKNQSQKSHISISFFGWETGSSHELLLSPQCEFCASISQYTFSLSLFPLHCYCNYNFCESSERQNTNRTLISPSIFFSVYFPYCLYLPFHCQSLSRSLSLSFTLYLSLSFIFFYICIPRSRYFYSSFHRLPPVL